MPEIMIRKLQDSDAPELFGLIANNRPQLAKFWWERQTTSEDDSRRFIKSVNQLETKNGAPTRGIILDEALIGVTALHTINWQRRSAQLGYWLANEQAGKGYITAAVGMLVATALDDMNLQELQIVTRASNTASRRVAEKLGFQLGATTEEPGWQTEEQDVPTVMYSLQSTQPVMVNS